MERVVLASTTSGCGATSYPLGGIYDFWPIISSALTGTCLAIRTTDECAIVVSATYRPTPTPPSYSGGWSSTLRP